MSLYNNGWLIYSINLVSISLSTFKKWLKIRLGGGSYMIRTRKIEIASIQFCMGVLVPFGFIFVQLSTPYGLY
jgi:hypothetical protein